MVALNTIDQSWLPLVHPKDLRQLNLCAIELENYSFFDNGIYVVTEKSGHCIVSFTCLLILIGCLSCPITTLLQADIQVKLDSYSGVTAVKLTTKNKGSYEAMVHF